ncbi:MAG: carboxypeptidase-like regulatory domain-containing protein [Gemmatimonadota bacterium]
MRHMDEGVLQAWLDGPRAGLSEQERAAVEEHLALCAECAVKVAALRASTVAVRGLLVPAGELEEIPDFSTVEARARTLGRGGPSDQSKSVAVWSRPRSRMIPIGWAASVLVALGAGWMANELSRGAGEPTVVQAAAPAAEAAEDALPPVEAEVRRTMQAEANVPREQAATVEGAEAVAPTPLFRPTSETRARQPQSSRRLAVEGRVTDAASGRPLRGAQVYLRGTTWGSLTNADGRYLIMLDEAPDSIEHGMTLNVDLIGYDQESRSLALGDAGTSVGDFQLRQTAIALDEIVVTGSAQKLERRALGNAVAIASASPAPAQAGVAQPIPVSGLTNGSLSWRAVVRADAEDLIGFPPRFVPGLDVLSVETAQVDGAPVLRVVQSLEGGGRLRLFQSLRAFELDNDAEAGVAAAESEGGVFLLGQAPLPSDAIRALLERARDGSS